MDRKPYMTLNYANGPGFFNNWNASGTRVDLRHLNRNGNNFQFPAALPVQYETHAGEDVAVFANGPWSHLFNGNYEQHTIPYLMAYAACIGDGLKSCD